MACDRGATNALVVSFHKIDGGVARVTLQLDVDPEGPVEKAGEKLGFIRRRAQGDLERFKKMIEERGVETERGGETLSSRADGGRSPGSPLSDDAAHRRPDGVDDATVAAVGKVSEALEWLVRARGRLYDFHQMLGHLDAQMGDAVTMLRDAGHVGLADRLEREVVGRNVLDGRWTFQVVEEFEDTYYDPICAVEEQICEELLDGRRHVFEAEMKEARRSGDRPAHEARPPAAHDPRVVTEQRPT